MTGHHLSFFFFFFFVAVPIKPKFTDQLITGQGLPEIISPKPVSEETKFSEPASVSQLSQSKITMVESKAASLDIPSSTPLISTSHKQLSLDTDDRNQGHKGHRKLGGELHPTKLMQPHFSLKEPDSPSHSEVDRIKHSTKISPKEKSSKKYPGARKSKNKESVTSRIKRKFSRSDADTKDVDDTTTRRIVGKATFYKSEAPEDSAAGDTISTSDSNESTSEQKASPEVTRQEVKETKTVESSMTSGVSAFYLHREESVTISHSGSSGEIVNTAAESVELCLSQDASSSSIEKVKLVKNELYDGGRNDTTAVSVTGKSVQVAMTCDENNSSKIEPPQDDDHVYEEYDFSPRAGQEVYENVEAVSEKENPTKKLPSVPTIKIEDSSGDATVGPSQDYIPMNLSGSETYENVDHSESNNQDDNEQLDVYDNAEFHLQTHEAKRKKTNSMYEAIEFHKGRELREISRRSRFRKTAKRQKAILLEDDKFEPITEQLAGGNLTFI